MLEIGDIYPVAKIAIRYHSEVSTRHSDVKIVSALNGEAL